jgi:hypothetical protein
LIFGSDDEGFKNISEMCDKFREFAVTGKTDNKFVKLFKDREFANQVAVMKRALGKRAGTSQIDANLLSQPEVVTDVAQIIKEIPKTFIKVKHTIGDVSPSMKGCVLNATECGGSYALLAHEIRAQGFYEDILPKKVDEFEVNPTITRVLRYKTLIKDQIIDYCYNKIKDYCICDGVCDYSRHPVAYMTSVSFRGGKVRQLSMMLPEINFLGKTIKRSMMKILNHAKTSDLFTQSKYYYSVLCSKYKAGDWIHSGDFESCTNRYDFRVTRVLFWEIFRYCTGMTDDRYRRIIFTCLGAYCLVEKNDFIDEVRKDPNMENKRDRVMYMLYCLPFLKQTLGQHMGASLSFYFMGLMHALCERITYGQSLHVGPATKWNIKKKRRINKSFGNVILEDLDHFLTSFGDDLWHINGDLGKILEYKEVVKLFNQKWSKKGDFISQNGGVFTERVLIRKGDTLEPLIAQKAKLLFREESSRTPYFLDTVTNLTKLMDNEYDLKWLQRNFPNKYLKAIKVIWLTRGIILEQIRELPKWVPLAVPRKYGGLGLGGSYKRADYKWMDLYSNIQDPREFIHYRKLCNPAPEMKKELSVMPRFKEVHAGEFKILESEVDTFINTQIRPIYAAIEPRNNIVEVQTISSFLFKYRKLYSYMKLESIGRNKKRHIADPKYDKIIGVDDKLFLACMHKKTEDDETYVALEETRQQEFEKMLIDKHAQACNIRVVWDYFKKVLKTACGGVEKHIQDGHAEHWPFEHSSKMKASKVKNKYLQWLPYKCILLNTRVDGSSAGFPWVKLPTTYYVKDKAIIGVVEIESEQPKDCELRFLHDLVMKKRFTRVPKTNEFEMIYDEAKSPVRIYTPDYLKVTINLQDGRMLQGETKLAELIFCQWARKEQEEIFSFRLTKTNHGELIRKVESYNQKVLSRQEIINKLKIDNEYKLNIYKLLRMNVNMLSEVNIHINKVELEPTTEYRRLQVYSYYSPLVTNVRGCIIEDKIYSSYSEIASNEARQAKQREDPNFKTSGQLYAEQKASVVVVPPESKTKIKFARPRTKRNRKKKLDE